ncbi:hypothetical protein [Nostoc sp. 106C]|uniref:hypothetical protein n=1 Tax=Nostoc sp. 106C TaxID=1932667 RepID=UPI00141261BC|nr:hypothetical protein [Nostoc sp. 106C]
MNVICFLDLSLVYMKVSATVAKMIQFCLEIGHWALGIGHGALESQSREQVSPR